ncbi:MAG: hypothetical protein ACI4GW_01400 [Lachnospiraceae bacterium]
MNIFKVITGNIVKWWQLTVMPILRIDNNQLPQNGANIQNLPAANVQSADSNKGSEAVSSNNMKNNAVSDKTVQDSSNYSEKNTASPDTSDAQMIMDRINREREEKRKQDMEKARLKAEEDAKLASIMNANKVDVNAFIKAGKEAMEHKQEDEALIRAQEIMDRLNREAAEDEAKKQAEIEAAKQKANETFGM